MQYTLIIKIIYTVLYISLTYLIKKFANLRGLKIILLSNCKQKFYLMLNDISM